jgi:hypothetical protein
VDNKVSNLKNGRLMEDEKFNMSLRKFLKKVGVTSQHEIERVVREQLPEDLKVKMVLPRGPIST